MNSKSKKRSPIALIASISAILIVAICGAVYYKYAVLEQNNEAPITQQENSEKHQTTELDSTDEHSNPQQAPANDKGDNPDSPTQAAKPDTDATTNEPDDEVELLNGYVVGQKPATEPTYVNGILIVNKKNPLPPTYNKGEDPKAKAAFEKMAAAAKNEGIELVAFSGFRSYEYQTTLYDRYVNRDGKEAADRYSARPGYSEHQSGLAFDIGEKGQEDLWLTSAFGESPAGKWLVENAHKYGFILRYPEGKEDITGFMYESWHFRYLEGDTATKVYKAGLTLEEYLGI